MVYGQTPPATADDSCGPSTSSGTPSVTADYETATTGSTTSVISNQIDLVNTGTSAIPLSDLTVRYWFTEDGADPLDYACEYALVGCANITGAFVPLSPAVTGADHYLQLGFSAWAGSLAPGASTGGIQNEIFQSSYAAMTQTNDYSFDAADTIFTPNPGITVYDDGTLIYGTEP